MNKPRNQFAALTEQDRKLILDLCSSHHYDQVVDQVAKPRSEGGLGINTSRSALCRFFTTDFPEPTHSLLAQYAATANIRHQEDGNVFLGAIRAAVEARVLEMLKNGKPLADMEKDFKILKTAQNLYLADAQWRLKNPEAATSAYKGFVDRCASAPDFDFVPVDERTTNAEHLREPSEFDQHIIQARHRQQLEDEKRPDLPADSTSNQAKKPVIPQIPPNSTSPSVVGKFTAVPFVRTAPKISRNDPCPCGSGLKYKKCCERAQA